MREVHFFPAKIASKKKIKKKYWKYKNLQQPHIREAPQRQHVVVGTAKKKPFFKKKFKFKILI